MSRPKTEPNSLPSHFDRMTTLQLKQQYIMLANSNHEVMCENASLQNALQLAQIHREHYNKLACKYFEANKYAIYGKIVNEEDTFFPSNNENYDTIQSDGDPDGND